MTFLYNGVKEIYNVAFTTIFMKFLFQAAAAGPHGGAGQDGAEAQPGKRMVFFSFLKIVLLYGKKVFFPIVFHRAFRKQK